MPTRILTLSNVDATPFLDTVMKLAWESLKCVCLLVGAFHLTFAGLCYFAGGGVVYVTGNQEIEAAIGATQEAEAFRLVVKRK